MTQHRPSAISSALSRVGLSTDASRPKVGDSAPDFNLPGSDGHNHTLKESQNVRGVVLAWYPKAATPG